jgi:type II secretory pathway component PulK
MNARLYQKLEPYLTALPVKTTIDTRYASQALRQAMGLSSGSGAHPEDGKQKNDNSFFLLRVDVYANDQHFVLYTMLRRDISTQGKPTITQLWQSFGTV